MNQLVAELYKAAFQVSTGKVNCTSGKNTISALLAEAAERIQRLERHQTQSGNDSYGVIQVWGQQETK